MAYENKCYAEKGIQSVRFLTQSYKFTVYSELNANNQRENNVTYEINKFMCSLGFKENKQGKFFSPSQPTCYMILTSKLN